jgi:hypothetical protein
MRLKREKIVLVRIETHSTTEATYQYLHRDKKMDVHKVDDNFSDPSNQMIIRSSFENQTTNAEEWIDPYDSVWLKILTFFVYIVEVMAASIMITFVYYETSGYAGHYRTLINRLLSYFYGAVIHTVDGYNKL